MYAGDYEMGGAVFGFVVDIAKNHFAMSVELDEIQLHPEWVLPFQQLKLLYNNSSLRTVGLD